VDGYAVRASDVAGVTKSRAVGLTVKGIAAAGDTSAYTIAAGEAIKIMTGARIPGGADAVIPLEHTVSEGSLVYILKQNPSNAFIMPAGADVGAGQLIFGRGRVMNSLDVAMMSACGIKTVQVTRRPKIAILSTGNEIVDAHVTPDPGKIVDSNRFLLSGLVNQTGAEVQCLGIAGDSVPAISEAIEQAGPTDMIIITGGIANGDFDKIAEVFNYLGIRNVYHGFDVSSSKNLMVGNVKKSLIFGLPGTMTAVMVNFYLFVRPAIDKMMRKKQMGLSKGIAQLWEDTVIPSQKNRFFIARLEWRNAQAGVMLLPIFKFGVFYPVLDAEVIVELPEPKTKLRAGDPVTVYFLNN
jgi:molybdenum cofactor synthesis domain-containing protein